MPYGARPAQSTTRMFALIGGVPGPMVTSAMPTSTRLKRFRDELFYGLRDYTKSLPDFFITENLQISSRKARGSFLGDLAASLADEPEVLAYVHMPFCAVECIFCNTFPNKGDEELQRAYMRDLLLEIRLFGDAGVFEGKTLRSIYFGGGTPTTFSNDQLEAVVSALLSYAPLSAGGTITTEATPVSVADPARIEDLARFGFTRLSLGCQSFDPSLVKRCNRNHTASQIREVLDTARRSGLTNSIDLMLGLPGQTLESVECDLAALEEVRPDAIEFIRHEIVNPKMIELFKRRPELMVSDDDLFDMSHAAHRWSDEHGYEQNGRFTDERAFPYRYYWVREWPLLAFGARSRSYTKSTCWETPDDLALYGKLLERGPHAVVRHRHAPVVDRMYRALYLGLQLKAGVSRSRFRERFDADPVDVFSGFLPRLEDLGAVEVDAESIRYTTLGSYFFEDVCCFIMDAAIAAEYPQLVRAPFAYGPSQQEERRAATKRPHP